MDEPKVKLTGLYERTSAKGNVYYVGLLGLAKVVMLRNDRAAEGEPGWTLFAVERPPKAKAEVAPARQDVAVTPGPAAPLWSNAPAGSGPHRGRVQRAPRAPKTTPTGEPAPFDDPIGF